MKNLFALIIAILSLPLTLVAQEQSTPEQRAKQTREWIEKETQRLSTSLELEYWQEFYVDSILTANIGGLQAEMAELQKARVSNSDIYQVASDKWQEATYNAYKEVFTEDQWKKYLKQGAAREKKARDKRAAKKN